MGGRGFSRKTWPSCGNRLLSCIAGKFCSAVVTGSPVVGTGCPAVGTGCSAAQHHSREILFSGGNRLPSCGNTLLSCSAGKFGPAVRTDCPVVGTGLSREVRTDCPLVGTGLWRGNSDQPWEQAAQLLEQAQAEKFCRSIGTSPSRELCPAMGTDCPVVGTGLRKGKLCPAVGTGCPAVGTGPSREILPIDL